MEVEEQASSSSGEETTSTSSMFIHHKVTKLDTLAGLAIKYNVSVGDIKRANGLLSDTAMYARETILVPTGALPIMHELQNLCAQVLTGVNRDPVLHTENAGHPASAAVARIATALNVVNGQSYPEDIPVSDAMWLAMAQCGPTLDPAVYTGMRSQQPQEVELTDRSSEGTYYLPPTSTGPTRMQQEAVRRRGASGRMQDETNSDSAASWGGGWMAGGSGGLRRPSHHDRGLFAGGDAGGVGGGGSENGRISTWFSELGKAIGDGVSQTVAKVKEAANQPVLARPSANGSLGALADSVIASRRRPPGASNALGRAPFTSGNGGMGASSSTGALASMGRSGKQGGKDD